MMKVLTVCPVAKCAKITIRETREDARKADRQHWNRVHAKDEPRKLASRREGDT